MLTSLLIYSAGSALVAAFMWLGCRAAMLRSSDFSIRRLFLLMTIAAALSLPSVMFVEAGPTVDDAELYNASSELDTGGWTTPGTPLPTLYPGWVKSALKAASWVCAAGMALVMLYIVMANVGVALLLSRGRRIEGAHRDVIFIDDDKYVPFSWFGFIAMSCSDWNSNRRRMLMAHEMSHKHRLHWVDNVLAWTVCVVAWWCPVVWLIRRELIAVHEYQADADVISQGIDAEAYQMCLIEKTAGLRMVSMADSLNHSLIKNRLIMIKHSKKEGVRGYLRGLVPVGVMTLLLVGVSSAGLRAEVSALQQTAESPVKVTNNAPQMQMQTPDASASPVAGAGRKVFDEVEVAPQYPGGVPELMMYMARNMKYPVEAARDSIEGRVVVRFVVTYLGDVEDVTVLKSAGNELLDNEAVRVVKSLPKFTPGKMEGKPVNVHYTLPVNFRLPKKK